MSNPIHFYATYAWTNDLVVLLCCIELGNHRHSGKSQGFTFGLTPNTMGTPHGQILIETETSLKLLTGPRSLQKVMWAIQEV